MLINFIESEIDMKKCSKNDERYRMSRSDNSKPLVLRLIITFERK